MKYKAVFIDYMGTILQEGGDEMKTLIKRIVENSDVPDPGTALKEWWGVVKKMESECYGDAYVSEDDIAVCAIKNYVDNYNLKDNVDELHELIQQFWVNAPIFPDVKPFFEKCPLPIYLITNNDAKYCSKAMEKNGLKLAGIGYGHIARAYKPHRQLFDKGLEISGLSADQVIHIGDSYGSDVVGARSAGIECILIDRKGTADYSDVTVIRNLEEAISLL